MSDEVLIRWEENRREQLGSAIALIFGLSTGALAYCGSLLTEEAVILGGGRTCWFLCSVASFVVTLLLSVAVTLSRLADVRATTHVVRLRGSEDPNDVAQVARLREKSRRLGNWTWGLFIAQILSFAISAGLLLMALWTIFHTKLFP